MAKLLRKQGFAATGLAQVVAESGAPKGSLYHYFPGGKDEIALEALRFAGDLVRKTLVALRASEATPGAIIRAYGALLAGWMGKSGYSDGCPVTTTLLETAPANMEMADEGRAIFAAWNNIFAGALRDAGVAGERADTLASMAIMSIEGSLILARVQRASTPIQIATGEISALFDRESESAREGV